MLCLTGVDKSYSSGRNRLHVLKSVDLEIGAGGAAPGGEARFGRLQEREGGERIAHRGRAMARSESEEELGIGAPELLGNLPDPGPEQCGTVRKVALPARG